VGNSPASEFYMRTFRDTLSVPSSSVSMKKLFILTRLWRWNRKSVPKRRHIKFRRRGITQKKAFYIQNKVKVWNH